MKIKNEKGSITIFVLVALLFMSAFLIISYASNVNKSKVVKEQSDIIQDLYMKNENIVDSYEEAYASLRKKNKQTVTKTVHETSSIELTNTFDGDLINYRIYGNSSRLPSGYQEVEYIEGTGTQYIDTGIGGYSSAQKLDVTIDFQVTEYIQNTWICGMRSLQCGCYNGLYTGGGFSYSQTIDYLARTSATASGNIYERKFMLFARDYNGTSEEYRAAKVKIYSTRIYINNELVRFFVPCYRITDNVSGMYDLINDVFYINNGTGDFVVGAEIINGIGDLIEDVIDVNYGRYKIPVKITNTNNVSVIKNIILNTPLYEEEYIDYKSKKIYKKDEAVEIVDMLDIPTYEDYTKIEILTETVPLKIEIEYENYTIID